MGHTNVLTRDSENKWTRQMFWLSFTVSALCCVALHPTSYVKKRIKNIAFFWLIDRAKK